jgi:hypothetical protein
MLWQRGKMPRLREARAIFFEIALARFLEAGKTYASGKDAELATVGSVSPPARNHSLDGGVTVAKKKAAKKVAKKAPAKKVAKKKVAKKKAAKKGMCCCK